jgi:hypothetical protein
LYMTTHIVMNPTLVVLMLGNNKQIQAYKPNRVAEGL